MAVDSTSIGGLPTALAPHSNPRGAGQGSHQKRKRANLRSTAALVSPTGGLHMQPHSLVAIVTILSLLTYFWMGLNVGRARGKSGIDAPAMTGDPVLERTIRAHSNTLEWLPIFLASM